MLNAATVDATDILATFRSEFPSLVQSSATQSTQYPTQYSSSPSRVVRSDTSGEYVNSPLANKTTERTMDRTTPSPASKPLSTGSKAPLGPGMRKMSLPSSPYPQQRLGRTASVNKSGGGANAQGSGTGGTNMANATGTGDV